MSAFQALKSRRDAMITGYKKYSIIMSAIQDLKSYRDDMIV